MRWLSRISRDLLGGTWADVFESYYEVKDLYYSTSEIAKKYMPVASGTCIELAYRQVGQYKFDPEKHMHTPVNLHITAADLPELARIIPRLSQAALLWLDRRVQSVDDIRSIQDELGMTSVFKGNPALLASTYTLHSVRNDHTHGRGTMGYDRRLMMETVDQHIDSIVRQVPSLLAVFLMMGVYWAVSRGYMDEAVRTYQMVLAEVDSAGTDLSVLYVIAGKAAEGLGRRDEAAEWYGKAISADPSNPNAHAAMGCILARAGRGTDALASYDRAVEIDPRYANMHMGRGNVLWHLGRPAEALESYRRASEADPSSARAHIAAGKIHESQGRPAEALESYRRASEANLSGTGPRTTTGMPDEVRGGLVEPMSGYDIFADPAGTEVSPNEAQARVLRRKGRMGEADDIIRHISDSKRVRRDD